MKRIFLLAAVLFAAVAQVAAQNSFAYQAVIRNNGAVVSNADVALRISLSENNTVYYQETQTVKTNEYGNINVNVGAGTVIKGSFNSVPWESLNVKMKLEVDAAGGSNFVELGEVQIKPAPYALYAAKSSAVIQPSAASSTEPIFAVKNSKGEVLFAVFEDGVKVYVDLDDDGSKAAKSRFAVAGRSVSKGEVDLLTIDDNGTVVYVDDPAESKAAKSRFAVAGRSAKGADDLLAIDGEGSTFYIDDDASGKAAKSRFAVAGRSAKGEKNEMLAIDNNGTVVYVDDPASSKAAKSRFAVAGRSAKGSDMMEIDGGGTTVYVDDPESSKAAKSRFAVAGRSAKGAQDVLTIDGKNSTFYFDNSDDGKAAKSRFAVAGRSAKSADDMFSVNNAGTVIYIDDDASGKAAKSRFAVAGRSAKGNDNFLIVSNDSTRFYINDASETNSGFAVVGKNTSNALLSMNKDSVNFKTSMYVMGEVQTASGTVSRMADISMPDKAYITGRINNDYAYTYYLNKDGEYFNMFLQAKSGDREYISCVVLRDGTMWVQNDEEEFEKVNDTYSIGMFYLSEQVLQSLSKKYSSFKQRERNPEERFVEYGTENDSEIVTYYNTIVSMRGRVSDNVYGEIMNNLSKSLIYVLSQFGIENIDVMGVEDNQYIEDDMADNEDLDEIIARCKENSK